MVAISGATIAAALGVAINIATDLMTNLWAWLAVIVLATAGAVVGLTGQRIRTRRSPSSQSPDDVSERTAHGVTKSHAQGHSFTISVGGDSGSITVRQQSTVLILCIAILIIVATIVGLVFGAPLFAQREQGTAETGFAPGWTTAIGPSGCDSGWVVNDTGRKSIPVTSELPSTEAVLSSGGHVTVTLQGTSPQATVLQSISVEVIRRGPTPPGILLPGQCGGDVVPRFYTVDLDKPSPVVVPTVGHQSGQTIPAKEFSYQVGLNDVEKIILTPTITTGYVEWVVHVRWSSGSEQGDVRIDDQGRPFRTTATTGAVRWCTNYDGMPTWVPRVEGVPCD